MGGRTMPVECVHGRVIDWGDFGPDPDDGSVGVEPCAECDDGGFPCPCGEAFAGTVWHCRCGWHMAARRATCWQCSRTAEDGAVFPYTQHLT